MHLPRFAVIGSLRCTVFAADRPLPLEGSRNFRDLGGYATTDGHKVKAGRV
jgi:protein-tyrosine phosphatase